ncbi:MAG: aldose 1-epimerase family protein [Bryobacteraceae bacterium]|nr:aldose 1-epimerase family protein [Bryobacteraceae bacterium]
MSRLLFLLPALLVAQTAVQHEGLSGLELDNGRVRLVVLNPGGAFASFSLKSGNRMNPFWDPSRMSREAGGRPRTNISTGHFLCVDGFGPVSADEQKASFPGHGEATRLPWEVLSSTPRSVSFRVTLPKVMEVLKRDITLAPGEQVVLVESEIESQLDFDRPLLWAEHATAGAPFLALGKTVVDASSTQCQTKPYAQKGMRTFASGENFTWPKLGSLDLRQTPAKAGELNHIGCLMDPTREYQYVTVLSTDQRLLYGYLFRRADYPWIQHWMNYPANGQYSWGIEFGMQPYDMTKRELVAMSPLFGQPTFRWLGARAKLATRYLMFITEVPASFHRVDDVQLQDGKLTIQGGGQRVELRTAAKL